MIYLMQLDEILQQKLEKKMMEDLILYILKKILSSRSVKGFQPNLCSV